MSSNDLPSAAQVFTYDELDISKSEIRLLAFSSGLSHSEDKSPLSCSISKVALNEAPAYFAISYVWGDASIRRKIKIKNVERNIPAQADEALRCILSAGTETQKDHEEHTVTYFWIDALCINQTNSLERSRQVAIMSEIFANAESVLVHMGPPLEGNIEIIRAITDAVSQLKTKYNSTESLISALEFDTELPEIHIPSALTEERIFAFYSGRWFERLWVLQEVALSKSSIAFYGRDRFDLMDAILLARWIAKRDYLAGAFRSRTLSPLIRSIDYSRTLYRLRCFRGCKFEDHGLGECRRGICYDGFPLDWLLQETHDHLNSEPRDKVYAILGLCSGEIAETITPDYSLPLATVYTQAARLACVGNHEGDFLHIMRLARGPGNKPTEWYKENDWPTWVPLWNEVYDPLANPSGFPWWIFDASRSTKAQIFPSELGDPVLKCNAVVVDEIEYVSRPFLPLSHTESTQDLLDDFEKAVVELSSRAAKAITPAGQSYATALGLTLASGYSPFRELEPELGETHLGAALQRTNLSGLVPLLGQAARDNLDRGLGDASRYLLQFQIHSRFRSVFFTRKGYMGLCSQLVVKGDIVCIPYGSAAPWVLRKDREHHVFVGPCYVHGIMQGEFFGEPHENEVRCFEIH